MVFAERFMKEQDEKTVLVSIMNNKRDWKIACDRHWYRIPLRSAPKIVRTFGVQYLAFYLTKVFGEKSFSVPCYANVEKITIVKRKELFPEEADDPKRDDDYFRLQIGNLQVLPKPVVSKRLRRIVFIETTPSHLLHANEINDLFDESPIEDRFWTALKAEGINAERQYFIRNEDLRFCLDFALFCMQRNIDVECDGDKYHLQAARMRRDKKRNNILERMGWSVLRYGSREIYNELPRTIDQVKETVNVLGGLQVSGEKGSYRLLPVRKQRKQESLFNPRRKA
jgi:very-short-patch-repair endonuclease